MAVHEHNASVISLSPIDRYSETPSRPERVATNQVVCIRLYMCLCLTPSARRSRSYGDARYVNVSLVSRVVGVRVRIFCISALTFDESYAALFPTCA